MKPIAAGYPLTGSTQVGPPGDWTWLRILKRFSGNEELYRAYTSDDGTTWERGGVWTHQRWDGLPITLAVVHGISLPPGEFGGSGIIDLFTNRLDANAHPSYAPIASLRVSAHFVIRRDGELLQFVPCGKRAWHAGVSRWGSEADMNSVSIGIELDNDGFELYRWSGYLPPFEFLPQLLVGLGQAYLRTHDEPRAAATFATCATISRSPGR